MSPISEKDFEKIPFTEKCNYHYRIHQPTGQKKRFITIKEIIATYPMYNYEGASQWHT